MLTAMLFACMLVSASDKPVVGILPVRNIGNVPCQLIHQIDEDVVSTVVESKRYTVRLLVDEKDNKDLDQKLLVQVGRVGKVWSVSISVIPLDGSDVRRYFRKIDSCGKVTQALDEILVDLVGKQSTIKNRSVDPCVGL